MTRYNIDLGVLLTIFEGDNFEVVAETEEEAIKIAKSKFRKVLEDKYSYVDYYDVTVNNIEELEG